MLLILGVWAGYFVFTKNIAGENEAGGLFNLGLDLSGGVYLEYAIDVSSLDQSDVPGAMNELRDLIENRVNMFGVSEPVVQTKNPGLFGMGDGTKEQRLTIQLPGIDSVEKAEAAIGDIPVLEFREYRTDEEVAAIKAAQDEKKQALKEGREYTNPLADEPIHKVGRLGGKNLSRASLQFNQTTSMSTGEPIIMLEFDEEGGDLFAELTKEYAGRTIPIYVDGVLISEPTVGEEYADTGISGGTAIISGGFSIDEAKTLAQRLNSGALPVDKMTLLSSQTIGASLGGEALHAGVMAGLWGLIVVGAFLILWYRLPGLISVFALGVYIVLSLAIFKLIPVTLTAAGIAGFILSIGMAVDANILIFERMKEEMKGGRTLEDSIREGFHRAWPSIRDGNFAHIISAVVLYWFGTSLIAGFALTLGIGVLLSMFSAITVSRTFLLAVAPSNPGEFSKKLFGNGLSF